MSNHIQAADLMSLDEYELKRPAFRTQVLEAKKSRQVPIGAAVTLLFENRLTVNYQIQEMLRIERTVNEQGIADELEAYNPLIPDGSNWKATMMIEFPDADERKVQLKYMKDCEHKVYAQIGDERSFAFADEDMERSNAEKTSSVHFLRFELTDTQTSSLREGAALSFGVDHPYYNFHTPVDDPATLRSLIADLN